MEDCGICGSAIETRWATCPACGDSDASITSPNLSIVNLIENSDYLEYKKKKAKKSKEKLKSECCEKYKRRKKSACKRCPLFATKQPELEVKMLRQV